MTAMPALTDSAPAKINLFLHVTGKRTDGYHLVDSLVVFADSVDQLSVEESDALTLDISGPYADALQGEDAQDNLVLRAAEALRHVAGIHHGARLKLEKYLPVGAGIGGGSADAAAALRLLSRWWEVAVPSRELLELAAGVGADVSACLMSKPVRMEGIGEILTPLNLFPDVPCVLVNPGKALPTVDVFQALTVPEFSDEAPVLQGLDTIEKVVGLMQHTRNDLEIPAIGIMPEIREILDRLNQLDGCLAARMSGSGATCFGVFTTEQEAQMAADTLRQETPARYWISQATISGT